MTTSNIAVTNVPQSKKGYPAWQLLTAVGVLYALCYITAAALLCFVQLGFRLENQHIQLPIMIMSQLRGENSQQYHNEHNY